MVSKEELCDSTDHKYTVREFSYFNRFDNPSYPDIKFIYKTDEYTYNYNGDNTESTKKTYHVKYGDIHQGVNDLFYDSHGNYIKIVNDGDIETDSDDTHTVTTWIGPGMRYVFAPETIAKYGTTLAGVANTLASFERFYYDGSTQGNFIDKGLLTRKEVMNGNEIVALTFEYDSYGNVTKTKDGRANAGEYSGYTTQLDYDTRFFTFPVREYNALGHYSEIVYDSLNRPAETKDVNGISSFFIYDAFGRTIKTVSPGDTLENPTKRYVYTAPSIETIITTSGGLSMQTTFFHPGIVQTEEKYNSVRTYKYIDGLGRTIQEKHEYWSGWNTSDNFYDSLGRCYKTSVPYITYNFAYSSPASQPYTINQYDSIRVRRDENHRYERKRHDDDSRYARTQDLANRPRHEHVVLHV
jgi:hypothetical protein